MDTFVKEVSNALYWSMLAATTVGPGTVVVASKIGADFDFELVWVIYIASCVAFTLQEGAARLTIVSGLNLGESLRYKYQNKAVGFGKRPRPSHNRYTRTDTYVRCGNGRYTQPL